MTSPSETGTVTVRRNSILFSFGHVHYAVRLMNEGDEEANAKNDGISLDNLMAVVSDYVHQSINMLNRDILTRENAGQASEGSTRYSNTKSMTIGNRTLQVQLTFDMLVEIPMLMIVNSAEQILIDLLGEMLNVLDPNAIRSTVTEIMGIARLLMTPLFLSPVISNAP